MALEGCMEGVLVGSPDFLEARTKVSLLITPFQALKPFLMSLLVVFRSSSLDYIFLWHLFEKTKRAL